MNKLEEKLVELGYEEYALCIYEEGIFIANYIKRTFENYSIIIQIVNDKLYTKEIWQPIQSKVFGYNLTRLTNTINILNQDLEVLKEYERLD